MKILVVSDMHDDEEVLDNISKIYKEGEFDYLFVLGDSATTRFFA